MLRARTKHQTAKMERARQVVGNLTGSNQSNDRTSIGNHGRGGTDQGQASGGQSRGTESYGQGAGSQSGQGLSQGSSQGQGQSQGYSQGQGQGPSQAPRYEQSSEYSSSSRPGTGQGQEGSRPGSAGYSGSEREGQQGSGMGSDLRMSGSEQHYKVGNQEELDSRREDMHRVLHSTSGMPHLEQTSSFRETISAAGDKKPWEVALEKTEAAAREVSVANFAADEARRALEMADKAEVTVKDTSSAHDRLLDEAQEVRGLIVDPREQREELQRAAENLDARQDDAARHNRALREADNAAAAKRQEFERLRPRLEQFDAIMRRLQQEYESSMQKSQAVHDDADRRHGALKDKEHAREELGSLLRDLTGQLRDAESDVRAAEEALARAREHHHGVLTRERDTRGKLDNIAGTYDREARQAQLALESARGWDEKVSQLRHKMREEEEEHSRLKQLQDRLRQELEAAMSDLDRLRARGAPTRQALEEAEGLILSRRKALREAEQNSKDAESRYHRLVREADLMQKRAAEALEAAKRHSQVYDQKMKEASLHQSRHAELWHEAQMAGDRGSETATGAFEKLREKVQQFTNEP